MKKWLQDIFCTVVRKELENVCISVVHPYRGVPIYSISWVEVVYVNDKPLTSNVKESHTAMALGRQYTKTNYQQLATELDSLLKR